MGSRARRFAVLASGIVNANSFVPRAATLMPANRWPFSQPCVAGGSLICASDGWVVYCAGGRQLVEPGAVALATAQEVVGLVVDLLLDHDIPFLASIRRLDPTPRHLFGGPTAALCDQPSHAVPILRRPPWNTITADYTHGTNASRRRVIETFGGAFGLVHFGAVWIHLSGGGAAGS